MIVDLNTALLVRAAPPASTFTCPDCNGDDDCATCGAPTRMLLLAWMQRELGAALNAPEGDG